MPQPPQSYYPRATLKLIIRFDEFGLNHDLAKKVPVASTKNLNGIASPRSPLVAQLDPKAPQGVRRYVLDLPGSATTGGPQDQTSSDDDLTWAVTVIPKSASWSQNGVKAASTMSAAIKYIDCPIDPRLARSIAVELVLGCITEDQFVEQNTTRFSAATEVIPTMFTGPYGETRTNVRFQGFVNMDKIKFGSAEPLISIECQDNSVLLHNQEMSPSITIDAKRPIDQAIAVFLSNYVQLAGISVEYRPSTDAPPILADTLSHTSFRPNFGPPMSKGSAGSQKASIWDYLVDICGAIGHSVRMDGTTIVVQRVRSLMTNSTAARPDDPFRPRTVDGATFEYRRFIYGRNIEEMEISRNFTKKVAQNIELRCLIGNTYVEARDIERAYKRWYSGPVTKVLAGPGCSRVFTATPNHPVLTRRGWVPAGELVEGDDLVCCSFPERGPLADPNVDACPTKFSELFDSLSNAWDAERRPVRDVDFHGDGVEAEVEIVGPGGLLGDGRESPRAKHVCKFLLETAREAAVGLKGDGAGLERPDDLIAGELLTPESVRPRSDEAELSVSDVGVTVAGSLSQSAKLYPPGDKDPAHDASGDSCFLCQAANRGAVHVTFDKVVRIVSGTYEGHVFNLQTRSGCYAAEGVLTHNCYVTERKTMLVSRFPQKADRLAYALPGHTQPDNKWTVKEVSGITDQKTLDQACQDYYESQGRQELGITVKTKNLGSFGGDNLDPDILDMKVGDTFELLVNRDNDFNELTAIEAVLTAQQANVGLMKSLGFSDGFAGAYAKAYTNANFLTTYKLKGLKVDWSCDEGVSLEVEGINYIEVRADKQLPLGQEPSNTAMQKSTKPGGQ